MPKPKALKVFRTPIGFHDAYVATPTKKAALEAWGSHRNLFALGDAEEVSEPKLTRAPLAQPGVVIKVSRGTATEQLEALPLDEKVRPKTPAPEHAGKPTKPTPKKLVPRPSRTKLEQAEAALAELSAANTSELKAIDDEINALQKRRSALADQLSNAVVALQEKRDRAQATYDSQVEKWRSES